MLRPGELEIAKNCPAADCSPEFAQQYTRWLATSHYENFNVASWLLPKELHQHFYNLYAYCRWADDLGDEIPKPSALSISSTGGKGTGRLLRGPSLASCVCRTSRTIVAKDTSAPALRDLLKAFRPRPNRQALSDLGIGPRLLRLFRKYRRPPGPVSLRLPR
jgi:phytoene/squalene synthetase